MVISMCMTTKSNKRRPQFCVLKAEKIRVVNSQRMNTLLQTFKQITYVFIKIDFSFLFLETLS